MKTEDAIKLILNELELAIQKFPEWPEDKIHGAAILAEETGESVQAALNFVYLNGSLDDLKKELAQAGAMAIRNLIHLG